MRPAAGYVQNARERRSGDDLAHDPARCFAALGPAGPVGGVEIWTNLVDLGMVRR
jgi:hypothetical protein